MGRSRRAGAEGGGPRIPWSDYIVEQRSPTDPAQLCRGRALPEGGRRGENAASAVIDPLAGAYAFRACERVRLRVAPNLNLLPATAGDERRRHNTRCCSVCGARRKGVSSTVPATGLVACQAAAAGCSGAFRVRHRRGSIQALDASNPPRRENRLLSCGSACTRPPYPST